MAGRNSSATVQQRQPLASSTMSASSQAGMPQPRRRAVSMPTEPNSLMMRARRRPPAFSTRWRSRVVLPAPRKPVMTVAGMRAVMPRSPAQRQAAQGLAGGPGPCGRGRPGAWRGGRCRCGGRHRGWRRRAGLALGRGRGGRAGSSTCRAAVIAAAQPWSQEDRHVTGRNSMASGAAASRAATASCMCWPCGVWPGSSGWPARQVVQMCRMGWVILVKSPAVLDTRVPDALGTWRPLGQCKPHCRRQGTPPGVATVVVMAGLLACGSGRLAASTRSVGLPGVWPSGV